MTWSSKFVRLYMPLAVWMLLIFVLSSLHKVPFPFIDKLSMDKIYHIIEYAILGYLILRVMEQGMRMYGGWMIILCILIGSIYGLSDEIHQILVPGRYFSWWDMTANIAGTALGSWIYLKIRL